MSATIERAQQILQRSGITPAASRKTLALEAVDGVLTTARTALREPAVAKPVQRLPVQRVEVSGDAFSSWRYQPPVEQYQPPAYIPPPSPIKIGHYFDEATRQTGEPNLFAGERHILLFGLNGAGKSTRFLIELLMTAIGRSLVVYDVKGELAAQTAAQRRRLSRVFILNPFNLHVDLYPDLAGDKFNPLEFLDPASDHFYSDVSALAHALIEINDRETQKHFPESAQGLLIALIMWEVTLARREGRMPSLFNVRTMLTEAEELGPGPDGKRQVVKGLKLTVARMIDEGGSMIAGLVGEFVREHGLGEIASIGSAAKTPTRWLIDPLMGASLEGHGVDFRRLRDEPITVYVILPPGEISEFRPWSRMVVTAALRAQYRPGRVGTLFVLDEFFAALGHMKVIEDVWAQVRGYGIQLMPIVQSVTQLEKLYGKAWENFAGQAGVTATIGPPGDAPTAAWMSTRSGNTTISASELRRGPTASMTLMGLPLVARHRPGAATGEAKTTATHEMSGAT